MDQCHLEAGTFLPDGTKTHNGWKKNNGGCAEVLLENL